jgi:shikimate kinase
MTEEQELISLKKEIEQLKQILKNREKRYEEVYNVFITNGSSFTTLLLQDQDCCQN